MCGQQGTRILDGIAVVRRKQDVDPVSRIFLIAGCERRVGRELLVVRNQMLAAVQNAVAVVVDNEALEAVVRRIRRRDRRHQALGSDFRKAVALSSACALLRDIDFVAAACAARVHIRRYLGRICAERAAVAREVGELDPLRRISVVSEQEIQFAGRHRIVIAVRRRRILEAARDTRCRCHRAGRLVATVVVTVNFRQLLAVSARNRLGLNLLRAEHLQCRVQTARVSVVHDQRNTRAVRRAVNPNLDILVRHNRRELVAVQVRVANCIHEVIRRGRRARDIAVDDREVRDIVAERRRHRIGDGRLGEVTHRRIGL